MIQISRACGECIGFSRGSRLHSAREGHSRLLDIRDSRGRDCLALLDWLDSTSPRLNRQKGDALAVGRFGVSGLGLLRLVVGGQLGRPCSDSWSWFLALVLLLCFG